MEKINSLFIPAHIFVIVAITALLFTAAFLFSFNPLLPLFGGGSLILLSLFFAAPLFLLSLLAIVRMSLDYSSQYFTLTLYDFTFSLSQLIGIGVALLGTLLLYRKKEQITKYPFLLPFLVMLLWGSMTFIFSYSQASTLSELIRVFGLFSVGFFAFIVTKKTADYRTLLIALLFSALVPLAASFYQLLFGIGFADSDVSVARIFGTFSHPNILSLYLFSMLVVSTLFLLTPDTGNAVKKKNLSLALIFIFSFFLLLTFTRVAWVTAFLFFAVILLARFRFALLPLLLFPVLLYFLLPTVQDRVQESLSPDPDSSIVWRQNLWHDVSLKTIQDDKTIIGYGMNTFPLISQSLRGENVGSHDPHNDFVRFFVEGGYIGVAVFLFYFFSIAYFLLRNALRQKAWLRDSLLIVLLFWICLLFAGLSDNIFKNTPVEWIFFIVSGALLALSRKKE